MAVEWRSFQRVYDLIHRVMPEWNDRRDLVSQTEAETIILDNSAHSLGIFREQQLAGYYRLKRPALVTWREARVGQQQIIAAHVEKLDSPWLYADLLSLFECALAGKLTTTHSAVLSPFDPAVWDRRCAEQLFDFSYRLEYHIPAPKRQYGYFALSLSHHGQLVGRMDTRMHRQTGTLEVISLWLQEGIKSMTTLQKGLRQTITDFTNWQQTTRVTLGRCS